MSANASSSSTFPSVHLIPKQETRADIFLRQQQQQGGGKDKPIADGRGVLIGILDTGVDPGALALGSTTTDGSTPKIVDVLDMTGAGDVDLSYETTAKLITINHQSEEPQQQQQQRQVYQVTGLSGRILHLSTEWKFASAFPKDEKDCATKGGVGGGAGGGGGNGKESSATLTKRPSNASSTSSTDPPAAAATSAALREAAGHLPTTVPVRLGLKRADEIYPRKLSSRVRATRNDAWQRATAKYVAAARQDLAQQSSNGSSNSSNNTNASFTKLWKDEYQARLDILQDKMWTTDDPGPLIDCVVWWDGTDFRAVIATGEDLENQDNQIKAETTASSAISSRASSRNIILDLTSFPPMTSFRKGRQYTRLSPVDQCHVAVQFYQNGRILSLVTDASPHGTHVAGICAAHPDGSIARENYGVAPGAQIVSFKIGDARLGSMETGAALTRALAAAIRYKCDVLNLSYGEGCAVPNAGRWVELASQHVVRDHQIVFVSSAGNNGPALSTVGAPGGTTSALLGVAAHVSPAMQRALYSLPVARGTLSSSDDEAVGGSINDPNDTSKEKIDITDKNENEIWDDDVNVYNQERHVGSTYTWSSVGPAVDGDWGVDVTAPGGAITAVSKWCLQSQQLMNGTSMSSPHTAGCVALLLSAAKQDPSLMKMQVTPTLIKRALKNTARRLPGLSTVEQGAGMIDVPAAWKYLQALAANQDASSSGQRPFYQVTIENNGSDPLPRGIYLRQAEETRRKHTWSVSVDPIWHQSHDLSDEAQTMRVNFEARVQLQSTVDWITAPEHFMVLNNGRSFKMDVDPTNLQPGLHTAAVHGIDSQYPQGGPLFTIPVTVAKPLPDTDKEGNVCTQLDLGNLSFGPAETKRFFFTPPLGATWMDVALTDTRDATQESSSKLYALHTVQLLPHAAYGDHETAKYYQMRPGQTSVVSIAVEAGITVELVVGRYWSTLGEASVHCKVDFRGIRPLPNHAQMAGGDAGVCIRAFSDLQAESLLPAAKLTHWWTPLRPKESPIVQPLRDERDVFPTANGDKEIYELRLVYEFVQEEKGSITPRVPTMQGVLYESGFESQLILVFDGDKKLLGTADAWPSTIAAPTGKIILRMQVRHEDPEKLEAIKDMPLWIERSLEKEITLSAFASKEAMVLGKASFRKRTLRKGCAAAVFFQEPPLSKIPSGCKSGDLLKGSFTLGSGDNMLMGEGKRPNGFPITFVVAPKPAKPVTDPDPPLAKDERSTREKINEALRDLKVARLDELTAKEKEEGTFEEFFDEFTKEYPKHLPLIMAKLRYLDMHPKRKEKLTQVIDCANDVLSEISEDDLSTFFGRKTDPDDPKANKLKKEMKETKSFLIEAMARSAMAHLEMSADDATEKFDQLLTRMKAWVDIEAEKQYLHLYLEREKQAGRYGSVVKAINKIISKEIKEKDFLYPTSKAKLMEERAEALYKLGYKELMDRDQMIRVVSCPRSYALF